MDVRVHDGKHPSKIRQDQGTAFSPGPRYELALAQQQVLHVVSTPDALYCIVRYQVPQLYLTLRTAASTPKAQLSMTRCIVGKHCDKYHLEVCHMGG